MAASVAASVAASMAASVAASVAASDERDHPCASWNRQAQLKLFKDYKFHPSYHRIVQSCS